MELYTADSDTDDSCYSYSVDELFEAVENNSKSLIRQNTIKKICNTAHLNLNETNKLDCYMLNDCNSEINIDNIETIEFNDALLNYDNMKIISNCENEAESVTNHIDNIIPDDDINKSSLEDYNIQNNVMISSTMSLSRDADHCSYYINNCIMQILHISTSHHLWI